MDGPPAVHPYASLRIPGTFVVVQGIPGDGLSNTMDRLPDLVLTAHEDVVEEEREEQQQQQQQQPQEPPPPTTTTSATTNTLTSTLTSAAASAVVTVSSNLGGLFTPVPHPTTLSSTRRNSRSSFTSGTNMPCTLFPSSSSFASRPLLDATADCVADSSCTTTTTTTAVAVSRSEDEDSFLVVSDHNNNNDIDVDTSFDPDSDSNSGDDNNNNNIAQPQTQSSNPRLRKQQPPTAGGNPNSNTAALIEDNDDDQQDERCYYYDDDNNNDNNNIHNNKNNNNHRELSPEQQEALDRWAADCRQHERLQRQEWGESAVAAAAAAAAGTTTVSGSSGGGRRNRNHHPLFCSEDDMWWVDATTGRLKIFESLPQIIKTISNNNNNTSTSSTSTTPHNNQVLGTLAPGTTVVALELITLDSHTWQPIPCQEKNIHPKSTLNITSNEDNSSSSSSSPSSLQDQPLLHHHYPQPHHTTTLPQYITVNDNNENISSNNNNNNNKSNNITSSSANNQDLKVMIQEQHQQRCYTQGRSGWIQVLRIIVEGQSPLPPLSAQHHPHHPHPYHPKSREGYVVLSWNGYSYLVPGLPEAYVQPCSWVWRVTCTVGAYVREGLDLSTKLLTVIPYGNLLLVDGKTVNAMGLSRLHVSFQDGGPSGDIITGWCSEYLNPLSGQRGPILQPLPMPAPALYRVILSEGAVLRSGVELSSPHIGRANKDTVLSITTRSFSEHPTDSCLQRLRLAGNGGWISLRLNKMEPENLLVVELERLDDSFDPQHPGVFHVQKLEEVRTAQLQSHQHFAQQQQQQQQQQQGFAIPGTPTSNTDILHYRHPRLRGSSSRHSPDVSSVDSDSQHPSSPTNNSGNSSMMMMYSPTACQVLGTTSDLSPGSVATTPAGMASSSSSHNHPINNKDDRCLICLCEARTATIVHGETGHIACCLGCARILKARNDPCPVCRLPIDVVIQHFWA